MSKVQLAQEAADSLYDSSWNKNEMRRRLFRARAMQHKGWVIDPRKHTWIHYWDSLLFVAIMFTAVITPIEVAFFSAEGRHITRLWWFNRVIDMLFVSDIFIVLSLAYQENMSKGGYWVHNRYVIMQRYATGWLMIDILSVAPWWFITFDWSDPWHDRTDALTTGGSSTRVAVLVRVVKLLRMLRLARVFKTARMHKYIIDYCTGQLEARKAPYPIESRGSYVCSSRPSDLTLPLPSCTRR